MPSLILRARLFDDDDNPVQRHAVTVETFDLSTRRWQTLIETSTDTKGVIEQRMDLRKIAIEKVGPALRLVEPGRSPRVLSPGPMLRIEGRARDLIADFGEIERLGDTGFERRDSGGGTQDTVAGLARKAGVPQTNILRNIALNPRIGTIVGTSATRPVPLETPSETAASRPVRAELDPGTAAEIETMRAINIDAAAKLSEKDRIIATREHELGLKTAALTDALARAAAAEAKVETAEVKPAGKEADIQSVFTGIGAKLGETQTVLKASKNPFRIGNIRVDLKGALAEEGKIVLGAQSSDGSGVSVDMAPDTGGSADATVAVPDVSGLTLSAARRVLRSVGLRIETATQTLKPDAAAHGQALRQTPAAGSREPHGSTVLVVFANVPDA
jgi:hypothetical protein